MSHRLVLSPPERKELPRRTRSRSGRAEDAKRARLILQLAGGINFSESMTQSDCSQNYILRWKQPFVENRRAGLFALYLNPPANGAVFSVDKKSAIPRGLTPTNADLLIDQKYPSVGFT